MPAEPPLSGRALLVPRPPLHGRPLAERLESVGARVDLRSTIDFEPPADPAPVRAAIREIDGYDWAVFTSSNGVRFFFQALAERPFRVQAAAVGPGTARALRDLGVEPAVMDPRGRAEDLARALVDAVGATDRVLVVRPDVARDVISRALGEASISVDSVSFYRTVPARDAARIAEDVAAGRYDGIVFTSPSTFRCLLEASGDRGPEVRAGLARTARIAIGEVTARALEREGFSAHQIAETPDEDGIVGAFLRHFSR